MKAFLLLAGLAGFLAFSLPAAHAQAEKVKTRAKDLKKNVEGAGTNRPPAKAAPAQPARPAPPAR